MAISQACDYFVYNRRAFENRRYGRACTFFFCKARERLLQVSQWVRFSDWCTATELDCRCSHGMHMPCFRYGPMSLGPYSLMLHIIFHSSGPVIDSEVDQRPPHHCLRWGGMFSVTQISKMKWNASKYEF